MLQAGRKSEKKEVYSLRAATKCRVGETRSGLTFAPSNCPRFKTINETEMPESVLDGNLMNL